MLFYKFIFVFFNFFFQIILFQAFPGSLGRLGTKRKFITPLPGESLVVLFAIWSPFCARIWDAVLNFAFDYIFSSDSFTTRMNVGETIFRRMEQVNFFLKVSFLAVHGGYDPKRRLLHTTIWVDWLESLSFVNFTTKACIF